MDYSNINTNRRGVSMVELTIATMVMGIMAAVAAPRFAESLQYHRLEMAAKRIVADIESIRSLAYTSGNQQTIRFNDKSSSYLIVGLVDPDYPNQANYNVDLTDSPYYCTISSVNVTAISYNGHGLPNQGGQIVIELGGSQRTITVNATTGRASY